VSRRDHHGSNEHGLERDVKLFFALTNAVSDAGCCAWDNKRAFNSIRPITAIRTVTLPAGSSRVEPGAVPATDLRLSWPTFSDAADQAGISRRYGGIYFEQGDLDARTTGRIAARLAWQKAQYYWQGS